MADERPAWQAHAECHLHPEVDFFPGRGEATRPAKAVCALCPVRDAEHARIGEVLDATMVSAVNGLIASGFLEAERTGPRRTIAVLLTPAGWKRLGREPGAAAS